MGQIEHLRSVAPIEYEALKYDEISTGDLQISVTHFYDDGTLFKIKLINWSLFITIFHRDGYYADDTWIIQRETDQPADFYVGVLNTYFPEYTNSVNLFLKYLLNPEE